MPTPPTRTDVRQVPLDKVRALQHTLNRTAKADPGRRFHALQVLSGTRDGVLRVTVGEDEKCGRVRRHGEHGQGQPRNGRLPRAESVFTVTVADGGDQLAQSRFRTVWYQHELAPSPARM